MQAIFSSKKCMIKTGIILINFKFRKKTLNMCLYQYNKHSLPIIDPLIKP